MIKLKRTREIEIDIEEAQNLVAQVLQEDFDFLSKEINQAKHNHMLSNMSRVEIEDWQNSMEVREAMKTLMRYYMTRNDYNEFMEIQRVYGNV